MANNCKQCFNTHYQPHCPLPKGYDCVAVYIAGRRTHLAEAANQKSKENFEIAIKKNKFPLKGSCRQGHWFGILVNSLVKFWKCVTNF